MNKHSWTRYPTIKSNLSQINHSHPQNKLLLHQNPKPAQNEKPPRLNPLNQSRNVLRSLHGRREQRPQPPIKRNDAELGETKGPTNVEVDFRHRRGTHSSIYIICTSFSVQEYWTKCT